MELKLVKQGKFLGTTCDFYLDKEYNILMNRLQIGEALQYTDPHDAIKKIHKRHKEILDSHSRGGQIVPTFGGYQESFLYDEKGIFTVVRYSRTKVSNNYFDWVYDKIQDIKKNGFYIPTEKDDKWLGVRDDSKKVRKDETDAIKLFVEYCKASGSGNADKYFISLTNLVRTKLNIPKGLEKNDMSQKQLRDTMALETVIGMKILKLINDVVEYHEIYKKIKDLISVI